MSIENAFNKSVQYYDDWVKQALPGYTDIFNVAVSLIPEGTGKGRSVLDLGAGTGLFSSHVLVKLPLAKFFLVDLAAQMLEIAKQRFASHQTQFKFEVKDYREFTGFAEIDAVISSLSIHHLLNYEKQHLFKNVYTALKPGGVFINVDQIAGESEQISELYWSNWLQEVRAKQLDELRIQESIERRRQYDRDATLVQQLDWLKQAGFADVDCVYKNYFIGVFFARK